MIPSVRVSVSWRKKNFKKNLKNEKKHLTLLSLSLYGEAMVFYRLDQFMFSLSEGTK